MDGLSDGDYFRSNTYCTASASEHGGLDPKTGCKTMRIPPSLSVMMCDVIP